MRSGLLLSMLGGSALLVTSCNGARSVPVLSQCAEDITVAFKGFPTDGWQPVVVPPEGTSLSASEEAERVWFEAADGTVLNEVSLTAEQQADVDIDFPPLVIKAEHCDQLSPDQ